jgi:ribonucleoside-diphosphate reductase alpha chain
MTQKLLMKPCTSFYGTGVGFSVERQFITKLPEVPEAINDSETVIMVEDSKEG